MTLPAVRTSVCKSGDRQEWKENEHDGSSAGVEGGVGRKHLLCGTGGCPLALGIEIGQISSLELGARVVRPHMTLFRVADYS